MPRGNHGDRSAEPLPIEELVARHELEIEGGPQQDPSAIGPVMNQEEWQRHATPIEYSPPLPAYGGPAAPEVTKNYETELDAGVRMQSAAIAGGSFGAAGCFDDDMLLRRANVIFNFIKNGLS